MTSIVDCIVSILAAWKWGDWRHWREYLPTIQYFIGSALLYNLLAYGHLLWSFPHPPNVFPNHLATSLFRNFTTYPSFLLIYLYRFPKGSVVRQVIYMLMWLVIWTLDEWYLVVHGLLAYGHGWNFAWSVAFLCVMLLMLRLHHSRPLLTYTLSVPIIIFLLLWFHVPAFKA